MNFNFRLLVIPFLLALSPILLAQQVVQEYIEFPESIMPSTEFLVDIHSNYVIQDLMILNENGEELDYNLEAFNVDDTKFVNHYSLQLTANDRETQFFQIMVTWDTGIGSDISTYDYVLQLESASPNQGLNENNVINALKLVERRPVQAQIYPNPSQGDFVYIHFDNQEDLPEMLKVYDVFGQLIDQVKLRDLRSIYRISNYETGNYIFTFYHKHGLVSEQVKISR